jgi:hypothetical protein
MKKRGDVVMKRSPVTSVLIMLIFIMFFTGCLNLNKETPSPPSKDQQKPQKEEQKSREEEQKPEELSLREYFPLTEGSTWQYLGEGNEFASFTREVLFAREDQAQIIENNGGTISASVFKTTDEEITRVFFQGEEYNETNFLDEEPNDNLIILKKPLKVGTKWETSQGTREIIESDAIVDTPAGKFEDCIKVRISLETSTSYEYFKDGIGMVKREFTSEDTTVTSTLEKYEIK